MGIRFTCPNGHKLNVKEFQAGRKGICPFCGAKIQIPTESTRPSSRGQKEPGQATAGAGPPSAGMGADDDTPADGIALAALGAPDESNGPQSAAFASAPAGPLPTVFPGAPPMPAPVAAGVPNIVSAPAAAMPAAAPPAAPPPGPAGAADPLAEAGSVVWYVRPPAGGQFGPATSEVMRNWLSEGRISSDSLVWREGWRDWLEAGDVFIELRPQPAATPPGGAADSPTAALAETAAVHPQPHPAKRTAWRPKDIAVVISLAVAVVILIFTFFWILYHPGT